MYVLFIEDQTSHQTTIEKAIERDFQERGERLASLFATNAAAAMDRLKLPTEWPALLAEHPGIENWNQFPAPIRIALPTKPIPLELGGISCDLEISADGKQPASAEVGAGLVRLFHFWREVRENETFKLVVYTAFPDWRDRLDPMFCDAFHDK